MATHEMPGGENFPRLSDDPSIGPGAGLENTRTYDDAILEPIGDLKEIETRIADLNQQLASSDLGKVERDTLTAELSIHERKRDEMLRGNFRERENSEDSDERLAA